LNTFLIERTLQTTEINELISFFQKRQFKAEDATDYLLEKLAERLVNIFDVSIQVLKIRMEKEKLNRRHPHKPCPKGLNKPQAPNLSFLNLISHGR